MSDHSTYEDLYRESRDQICTLVTPDNEHMMVPACPEWSLHDLVSHLTGLAEDFASDNLEGVGGKVWTAAQVERYREADLATIYAKWREATDLLAEKIKPMGRNFLGDIVVHEFDIRGVLGNTDARDSRRMAESLDQFIYWTDVRFRKENIPALNLRFDGKEATLGEGDATCTLETSAFELFRALAGRRSSAQVRGYQWSTDGTLWVDKLAPFGNRDTDLVE